MRRFRRRRIIIRSIKLPRPGKVLRQIARPSVFIIAMILAFSPVTLRGLKTLTKWAGGSEGVAGAVYMFEFGARPDAKTLSGTLPEYTPEVIKTPAPQATEKVTPRPSATPISTPTPTPTPTPMPVNTPPLTYEGIEMKGETSGIDVAALFSQPLGLKFDGSPQILIIHTHSTESYLCDGSYKETGEARTLDNEHNVIRVGEELTRELEKKGFSVIHDRVKYDYPSYSGSYSRSLGSVEDYLKKYPSIRVVIDLHRDAFMDADGKAYKTAVSINGKSSSQIMLVVGTGSAGLSNPHWQENLKLAFQLQAAMNAKYKGLTRPIVISADRYNQQTSPGSLLIEVGSSGDTLEEALAAIRMFADAAARVLGGE